MTTSPAGRAPREAAESGLWLWDVLLVGSSGLATVLVALADDPVGERIGAGVLVLGLAVAWLAVGRRLAVSRPGDDRPEVLGYVALLVVGIAGAALLVPDASWALFVVIPQAFWILRVSRAVVVTVVLTPVVPTLGALGGGAALEDAVGQLGPQALFMTAFGVLVGVWIHRITDESAERARLIAQLEASRAEVESLSHRAGVAAERERLAGEIHDTLAQGFTSIVTLLQAAQAELATDEAAARRHVQLAVASAKENLREARDLVAASAPAGLGTHSLGEAIGRQVERIGRESGVHATHTTTGPGRRLPAEHEVVLLRAAQELLANVVRHADARTVTVALDLADPAAAGLTVTDDGSGFDPAAAAPGSYGLAMLRARVQRLGGGLAVESGAGHGTRVAVRLPTADRPATDRPATDRSATGIGVPARAGGER